MLCDRGRCPLPPVLAPSLCCRGTLGAQTVAKGGGLLVKEESVRWREAMREALFHLETKPLSRLL